MSQHSKKRKERRREKKTGVYNIIDTVTQVSIKFWKEKKANKNMGVSIQHNTNDSYENGDRCVRIWKSREMRIHVYIHICRL